MSVVLAWVGVTTSCDGPTVFFQTDDAVLDTLEDIVAEVCTDGVQNGDETDIDCGGSCLPCGDGGTCGQGSD
ncbi:MAG: hypothetical protein COW42_07170, partial [Deltaproteobacteria bacterium CG17_big_fil_post_rev_8_21_14_2_50_63_7]